MVLVVNKWDLVDPKWKEKAAKYMMKQVEKYCGACHTKSIQFVSAKDHIRVDLMLKAIKKSYQSWNSRISTGMLNIWLNKFKKVQKLPTARDRKLKIFYISQIKTRPPTFSVFINDMDMTDEGYIRYMKDHLAEEFGLEGVPIRLVFRGTKYKELKKKMEKVVRGDRVELRRMFLKRRKLKTFAKIKLDQMAASKPN